MHTARAFQHEAGVALQHTVRGFIKPRPEYAGLEIWTAALRLIHRLQGPSSALLPQIYGHGIGTKSIQVQYRYGQLICREENAYRGAIPIRTFGPGTGHAPFTRMRKPESASTIGFGTNLWPCHYRVSLRSLGSDTAKCKAERTEAVKCGLWLQCIHPPRVSVPCTILHGCCLSIVPEPRQSLCG